MHVQPKYVLLSILLGLAGMATAQEALPKKLTFSLSISASRTTVKAGSPMVLRLPLTQYHRK